MNRGKWSTPGVPHKGWVCEDIEDLEDERMTCEMCESQEIRFVHHMRHPSYPASLACGCDCAGQMEGDTIRAENRDRAMKNAAARRKNFPQLKSWKLSQKGNRTISKDGKRVTIFGSTSQFKFVINHPRLPEGKFGRDTYPTLREAQMAAFDASLWLDEHWRELK
jgi:hypothetical protein